MDTYQYKVSLVICTYNRDKYLPEALESARKQTCNNDLFQIIIVDNNSTDHTAAITQKFINDNPRIHAKYCFEQNKGLSFARNRGVKEADAPVICYTDDDAILSPGYISTMVEFFETNPAAAGIGGKVIPKYEDGKEPEWMNKYLDGFVGKVDYGSSVKKYDASMKYPPGCNMTYKKDILIKAGGFNNQLTFRSDDKYIFYKVNELSDEIYYIPDAWVYHYIDQKRLDINNFKKLFLKTGNEEKKRIISEQGSLGLVKKFIEFVIKFTASLVLFFLFLVKGEYAKGKYVALSQWCTLKGFLQEDVFVR